MEMFLIITNILKTRPDTLLHFQYYPGGKRPVWFVFSGIGSQWPGMGKSLLKLPVFAAAINKCQQALKPHCVDVINIITSDVPRIFSNIVNCFVGIVACQVCTPESGI
jgi:fatty acid synthase